MKYFILLQFDNYCFPQKNVTFFRYKLFLYKQSKGQCFDNFVSRTEETQ